VKNVNVRKSDKAEISVFDRRDDFLASFRDGKWVADDLFEDWEYKEFTILEDDNEITSLMFEARKALNKPLQT
jgi:hypothetical protein